MKQSESTVSIFLPTEGNVPFVEGALNGKNFRVRTGCVVEVPTYIASILAESQKGLQISQASVEAYSREGGKKL